jgi:cytochrome P450/deferrochelatase/peroxidase EfeB
MLNSKYFAAIDNFEQAEAASTAAPQPFETKGFLKRTTIITMIAGLVLKMLMGILRIARVFFRRLSFGNFHVVLRSDDILEVLRSHTEFEVPFGREMTMLAGGAEFVLGITDPDQHDRQREIIKRVLPPKGLASRARNLARRYASGLIANSGGRIDVMRDCFIRATTEVCFTLFGVRAHDAYGFADQCLAVSNLLFADPLGKPNSRAWGREGALRLNAIIDDAISHSRRNPGISDKEKREEARIELSVIDRLVHQEKLSDIEIRAIVLGLITGFIPTVALAIGNIWLELESRPNALKVAKSAAVNAKDKEDWSDLNKVMMELARLRPALSPGQWRFCSKAINFRGLQFPKGATVLVATALALRDPAIFSWPDRFNANRKVQTGQPITAQLIFGSGPHDCLGAHLATAVMEGLLCEVLNLPGLCRATGPDRNLERLAAFPYRYDMVFTTMETGAQMRLVIVPVTSDISDDKINALIAELGHPAKAEVRQALDQKNCVHFVSLALLRDEDSRFLSLELSADGCPEAAIDSLIEACGVPFVEVFAQAASASIGNLAEYLKARIIKLESAPWGKTGLDFNGLPGVSVRQKAREHHLSLASQKLIDDWLQQHIGEGRRPMRLLRMVRRALGNDHYLRLMPSRTDRIAAMNQAQDLCLDAACLSPSRKKLAITQHRTVPRVVGVRQFIFSSAGLPLTVPVFVILLANLLALQNLVGVTLPIAHGISVWKWIAFGLQAVAALAAAAAVTTLVIAAAMGVFWLVLRFHENRDVPSDAQATETHMRSILEKENLPGIAQSHILAIGDLKPGLFRVWTHALGLWGIKQVVKFFFRSGFVLNMGTIHYARWWRLPGTRKVAFYSNYDGSWENYLEDFVARARWGQTAAWSNWVGFPKTRGLVFEGAKDADRFKRWVRTVQQPVHFWYSRFPELTTEHIRRNSLIRDGLENAQTEDEARDWLGLFGSSPRAANGIESADVQSLVFSGQGKLPYVQYLFVQFPEAAKDLGLWLSAVTGTQIQLPVEKLSFLKDGGALKSKLEFNETKSQARLRLATDECLCFGDHGRVKSQYLEGEKTEQSGASVFLAISAIGFRQAATIAGQSADALQTTLDSFPYSFRAGMASRARILGDAAENAPANWEWSDSSSCDRSGPAVHATLLVYGMTENQTNSTVQVHTDLLGALGGKILKRRNSTLIQGEIDREPFGFRDGISQPVLRGTRQFAAGASPGDVVEPGEVLLGYLNNLGMYPITPVAPALTDIAGELPFLDPVNLSKFPDFRARNMAELWRDFGRNGTFCVIRELDQDVKGFEDFVQLEAQRLRSGEQVGDATRRYTGLDRTALAEISPDWIAAKLVGRWKDGRPLVTDPLQTDSSGPTRPADLNSFSYGSQDPEGLACPFGAHVRRANPRDSKEPNDPREQAIMNRHRILRRGRAFLVPADGVTEERTGLMFVALCSDLERQFEFIQQTWLNGPSFHGLQNEPDPLVGAGPRSDAARTFTIPTAAGPVRLRNLSTYVKVRGGGYFFLPGFSAIRFLASRLQVG